MFIMDSCHILDFIFGTKKATSELSKCFSNISENITQAARDKSSSTTSSSSSSWKSSANHSSRENQTPPKSPLKLFQSKLVNFVSKVQPKNQNVEESTTIDTANIRPLDSKAELVCVQSGTYKATLVRSSSVEYHEETKGDDDAESANQCIIINPIHDDDDDDNNVNNNISSHKDNENITEIIENPLTQQQEENEIRDEPMLISKHDKHNNDTIQANDEKDENNCKKDEIYNNNNINDNDKQQATFRAERIVLFENHSIDHLNGDEQAKNKLQEKLLPDRNDKRSLYVRDLVRSIESGGSSSSLLIDFDRRRSLENEHDQVDINNNDNTVLKKESQIEKNNDLTDMRRQQLINGSSNSSNSQTNSNTALVQTPPKPMTLVKPLPPKAPPKSFRAKCIRHQLSLNKPMKMQQLFQDEKFLIKLFDSLEPIEICAAAQVCRRWRDILYSDHKYWRGLINVIDCTQLRRDHLVECIVNTLQSAKMKQQQQQYKLHEINQSTNSTTNNATKSVQFKKSNSQQSGSSSNFTSVAALSNYNFEHPHSASSLGENELPLISNEPPDSMGEWKKQTLTSETIFGFDCEDVWRIQELCNRFALQKQHNHSSSSMYKQQSESGAIITGGGQSSNSEQQQQQHSTQICSASKSSSIPSQISSTFSSASLSSILSPLSESSRVETMKEKLYTSIDSRGFNAICLFGATDDDIEDLVCKIPSSSHERITIGRLNNCSITNRGLDRFITSFYLIDELELTGCNELTNALDLSPLNELRRLIITDCINIADGLAQKLMQILHKLTDLTIQAYHLTDAFIEYLSMNCDTSKLKKLELQNCKEITNQTVIVLAKHFCQLQLLSISGSTKISDDGIEILAEQATNLESLDLSWCPRVTDASLECIACELSDSLSDLILDRNVNITDIGLSYLASMNKLSSLQIRWCARITDSGIESLINMESLRYLSLAGLNQITARSLLGLVHMNLIELELTNCPAVNDDLVMFLSTKLPDCNIIF